MPPVINEPEGLLDLNQLQGGTRCTDVVHAATLCPGRVNQPGWVEGCQLPLLSLQRFANRAAAAVRKADPSHLITLGGDRHATDPDRHATAPDRHATAT